MSFEDKKLTCAACGAYLFEDDDVVFCPECGAPHHRDCYNQTGHCAVQDKHGTDDQYDSSANSAVIAPTATGDNTGEVKCPMCGAVYSAEYGSCPSCGVPAPGRMGRMAFNFDYLGGVPGDMELGKGVTADEAKQFVFSNSQRYIPKFAANTLGKKASFNWAAFFFPCGWFLCRKMYKAGALAGVLQIAFSMFVLPFYGALAAVLPDGIPTYTEMYELILSNLDKIGVPAVICAFVGIAASLILRLFCGIMGDYFYRNYTLLTVSRLKKESEDIDEDFRKRGGVSFIMFAIGVLAVEYLPQFLYMLVY